MTARPLPSDRVKPRKKNKNTRPSEQWLIFEVWLKIIAYLALSCASIAAIARLIPYQQIQQTKLEEVQQATLEKEERVNQLRSQFKRNFDPERARLVMSEQSPRRDPHERRIFWTNP